MAAMGAIFFALKGIFIKLAFADSPELDALTLLAIRMGISLPVYAMIGVWAWRRRLRKQGAVKLTRMHYIAAMSIGLVGYYVASVLDFTGLHFVTAQLERLILFTYPLMVIILGAMFFHKRIRPRSILYMLIAYGGIVLIFARGEIATGEHVVLGAALVFGAALSFAIFQLLAGERVNILGSILFTCLAMSSASIAILVHFMVQSILHHSFGRLVSQSTDVYLLGIAIAIISTLIPSFLYNLALGRIGAEKVSVIAMVSPLVTIVLAVSILDEPFGWVDAIGTALIIFGIGLFTWSERKASVDTV